jgi:hypothetical protein
MKCTVVRGYQLKVPNFLASAGVVTELRVNSP